MNFDWSMFYIPDWRPAYLKIVLILAPFGGNLSLPERSHCMVKKKKDLRSLASAMKKKILNFCDDLHAICKDRIECKSKYHTTKYHLNNRKNPYDSIIIPINGKPMRTTVIPPKKAIDAFTLCRWKKKRNVRSRPMTQANPQMNKI